jgi:hypothetical protein
MNSPLDKYVPRYRRDAHAGNIIIAYVIIAGIVISAIAVIVLCLH